MQHQAQPPALIALRAKQGECEAVAHEPVDGDPLRVQPLFELVPGSPPAETQLRRVERSARKLHAAGRHIMVDASPVFRNPDFGRLGPLGELVDRLSGPSDLLDDDYPTPFTPVVCEAAGSDDVVAVGRICHEIGIGAALRLRPPFNTSVVEHAIELLRLPEQLLDVIIDVEYIENIDERLATETVASFDQVGRLGHFRSMALLGGSVPPTLENTNMWQQPRREEELWKAVRSATRKEIRLGDYGVTHPFQGTSYRSNHVSLKYASGRSWTFCRERMSNNDQATISMDENSRAHTLRRVCQKLVNTEHFTGAGFSWGDHELSEAARGRGDGLGSTSKPVAYATSHHLAYLNSVASSG